VRSADVVTCYLCGHDWPEDDDGIFVPRQPTYRKIVLSSSFVPIEASEP
jgi:hypothetical protein